MILTITGTVTDGVNAKQTLTADAAAGVGSFTITYDSIATSAIAWNATAAGVQAALEAHASIGAGNVSVTGGPVNVHTVPLVVEFIGALAGMPIGALSITDDATLLDGPEGSPVTITPTVDTVTGVIGSARGLPVDTLIWKSDGIGIMYYNSGTSNTPVWNAMEQVTRESEGDTTGWKSAIHLMTTDVQSA